MGKMALRAIKYYNSGLNLFEKTKPPQATFVFYHSAERLNDVTSIKDPKNSTLIKLNGCEAKRLLASNNILPQKETHIVIESIRVNGPREGEHFEIMNRIFPNSLILPNGLLNVDGTSVLLGKVRTEGLVHIFGSRIGGNSFIEMSEIKGSILEDDPEYSLLYVKKNPFLRQLAYGLRPPGSIILKACSIEDSFISTHLFMDNIISQRSYVGSFAGADTKEGRVLKSLSLENTVIPDGRKIDPGQSIRGLMLEEELLAEALRKEKDLAGFIKYFFKDGNTVSIKNVTLGEMEKYASLAVALCLLIEEKRPDLVKNILFSIKNSEATGVLKFLKKFMVVSGFIGRLSQEVAKKSLKKTFLFRRSIEDMCRTDPAFTSGKTFSELQLERNKDFKSSRLDPK